MNGPILVTGGAGFIGANLVRRRLGAGDRVVNLDLLTYAGNRDSLAEFANEPRHVFVRGDIGDGALVGRLLAEHRPRAILHLAAESHVDRSIDDASAFMTTNVLGTQKLLEGALGYWRGLDAAGRQAFRFVHVSTDEVFGSLGATGCFDETTRYDPRSPYAASKAGSDHVARAYFHTHGLPVVVTNCTNNYGPYQFPEKLIPTLILGALEGRKLPIYGRGANVRDWLYVEDHAAALERVAEAGEPGRTYCIGGRAERTNLDVARAVCAALDRLAPRRDARKHDEAIEFVADRPGHDLRYAMDIALIGRELGWQPAVDFDQGIARTVAWYIEHRPWWQAIRSRGFAGQRLGVAREAARS
ncbi:MAG: dTDP-glucose 4,6-dehydratase [Alphaproteobacteria bacterium]|nr:dTDP-glucose 4,6-dehydratase [Alphaproteobacteria bacterium]